MVPTPQVPLVKCDLDPVPVTGLIEDADCLADLRFRIVGPHHALEVGVWILTHVVPHPVAMDGNIVQQVSGFFQQRISPIAVGSRGGEKIYVLVGAQHQFGTLGHQRAPLVDALLAELMPSPVLVADAPIFHIERLRMAVLGPLAGEFAFGLVAIFHPVAHLLHRAGAGVGADERLAAYLAAPLDELVGAEGVRILDLPCLIPDGLAVRPHSVFPVVGRHETTSRPPHDRDLELLYRLDHILAEPILVS